MIKRILKIIGLTLVVVLALLGVLIGYAFHAIDDDNLGHNAEVFLREALGTKVTLQSAKLNILNQTIAIYGFEICDRKDTICLHVDTLEAELRLMPLLRDEVVVKNFKLAGAHGVLYKERQDSAANYQFIVDAFAYKGAEKKKGANAEEKRKPKVMLDLHKVAVSRTSFRWNVYDREELNTPEHKQLDVNHLWVDDVAFDLHLKGGGAPGLFEGKLKSLTAWERHSKTKITLRNVSFDGKDERGEIEEAFFAYQEKKLRINDLTVVSEKNGAGDTVRRLKIENLSFETDNGKPRRNAGKPKAGEFDAGHLDVDCSIAATCSYLTADSIAMSIDEIKGEDHASGLRADLISMSLNKNSDGYNVSNMKVVSGATKLDIPFIHVDNQRYGKKLQAWKLYATSVKGEVVLKELARPFAKVLGKFDTPLLFTTSLTATTQRLDFKNIKVRNRNGGLTLSADGHVLLGNKKSGQNTYLEFDVHSMKATSHMKDVIVSHFVDKLKLHQLLSHAGDVSYRGKVVIPYRRQIFKGVLGTDKGALNVDVTLNSDTRYITGRVSSDSLDIKEFVANKNLGKLAFEADFSFDICSKKMARKLHRRWGKLPAGYLRGKAFEASYKFIKLHDVKFNVESDAEIATGSLSTQFKTMDVSADFSFKSCDMKHSLKVKPHIKMHNFFSWFKKKKKEKK